MAHINLTCPCVWWGRYKINSSRKGEGREDGAKKMQPATHRVLGKSPQLHATESVYTSNVYTSKPFLGQGDCATPCASCFGDTISKILYNFEGLGLNFSLKRTHQGQTGVWVSPVLDENLTLHMISVVPRIIFTSYDNYPPMVSRAGKPLLLIQLPS